MSDHKDTIRHTQKYNLEHLQEGKEKQAKTWMHKKACNGGHKWTLSKLQNHTNAQFKHRFEATDFQSTRIDTYMSITSKTPRNFQGKPCVNKQTLNVYP